MPGSVVRPLEVNERRPQTVVRMIDSQIVRHLAEAIFQVVPHPRVDLAPPFDLQPLARAEDGPRSEHQYGDADEKVSVVVHSLLLFTWYAACSRGRDGAGAD